MRLIAGDIESVLGRAQAPDATRRSRSARSHSPSSPASRARRCSTCRTRTTCAPRARRVLSPRIVDVRHIFRNALLPVTTIIGLQTGLLLSGAVLTETIFAFPRLGTWLSRRRSASASFPILQGGILFVSFVFVLVNLLVDVSYAIINPRIRVS